MQITALVGSLRKDSFHCKFGTAVARLAPPALRFSRLETGNLPLYNQNDDENGVVSVKRLKADIIASKGVLFVTPEYNHAIPSVNKNTIEHAVRPHGKTAWVGKFKVVFLMHIC